MKRGTVAMLSVLMLTGCAQLSGGRHAEPTGADAGGDMSPMAQGSPVPRAGETLLFQQRLMRASEETLAELPAAEAASDERPRAALRHALWLATPGHPGNDPAAARRALKALLQPDSGLDAPMRALVRLRMHELQRTVGLRRDAAELKRENDRLRAKLKALTDLERRMGQDEEARP